MSKGENGLLRDKRGISPVVATVILVAVTIVVAVAVAYWMGGIAGLYTRFEEVKITSAYPTYDSTVKNWTVTINLKNTGSADATIEFVLINGKPISEFKNATGVYAKVDDTTPLPLAIKVGETHVIKLQLRMSTFFTAGQTIEIKLHSASGQDYPKSITLS